MWPRDAYVGQRVVAKTSKWRNAIGGILPDGTPCPKKGVVYTIAEIRPILGHIGLKLKELGPTDSYQSATGFKPVDESRLDVFRKLLAPVNPKKVKEVA